MRSARALLILPLLAPVGACYRYVPATPDEIAPQSEVRVELSAAGVQSFRRPLASDLQRIDGRLVRWDDGSVAVEVLTQTQAVGFAPTTSIELIELPADHVATVHRRRLDGWATAAFVAGVVGVAAAALLGTRTVGGGLEDPEPPPEGEASIRIWLPLTLSLPRAAR